MLAETFVGWIWKIMKFLRPVSLPKVSVYPTLVLVLHLVQSLDRVGCWLRIYQGMMSRTQENEVLVKVYSLGLYSDLSSRSILFLSNDVGFFTDYGARSVILIKLNQLNLAPIEGTSCSSPAPQHLPSFW